MNDYEQTDLAFTAIGHLIVAWSIVYAARQWKAADKSLGREIARDTREFLTRQKTRLQECRQEIGEELGPWETPNPEFGCKPLSRFLNTLEETAIEATGDFYDREMIARFLQFEVRLAWSKWGTYISGIRSRHPHAWEYSERFMRVDPSQ